MKKLLFLFISALILFSSCKKDEAKEPKLTEINVGWSLVMGYATVWWTAVDGPESYYIYFGEENSILDKYDVDAPVQGTCNHVFSDLLPNTTFELYVTGEDAQGTVVAESDELTLTTGNY